MNYKKSYILFTTIILVYILSIFTIDIIQNKVFATNLNKLKYLHLQALIHMDKIKQNIKILAEEDINKLMLNDDRFYLNIKKDSIDEDKYYISIKSKDENVRLYESVIK